MIDIWLIFTLAIPLAEVLLHTKIARLNSQIKELKQSKSWIPNEEIEWLTKKIK